MSEAEEKPMLAYRSPGADRRRMSGVYGCLSFVLLMGSLAFLVLALMCGAFAVKGYLVGWAGLALSLAMMAVVIFGGVQLGRHATVLEEREQFLN